MTQTMQCPGCHAHLELPSLAMDQPVQCPRCQFVFAPLQPQLVIQRAPPPIDDEPTPDEPLTLPRPQPLRGESLANAAMLAILFCVLAHGAHWYHSHEQAKLDAKELALVKAERDLPPLQEEIELERQREFLQQWDRFPGPHQLLLPASILFLAWLYTASTNTWNMHALGIYFVPATAVISFFIPGLNLFWPYLVMQEIWRASDPRTLELTHQWKMNPPLKLAIFWWICFLASMCLWICRKPLGMDAELADEPDLVAFFAAVSHVIAMVEGVLLIFVIFAIRRRQAERHARLSESSA